MSKLKISGPGKDSPAPRWRQKGCLQHPLLLRLVVSGWIKYACGNVTHAMNMMFDFWFVILPQLELQLQQERIQVVRSIRVERKRPTESNGSPAINLGFEVIRIRKMYKQKRNSTKLTCRNTHYV